MIKSGKVKEAFRLRAADIPPGKTVMTGETYRKAGDRIHVGDVVKLVPAKPKKVIQAIDKATPVFKRAIIAVNGKVEAATAPTVNQLKESPMTMDEDEWAEHDRRAEARKRKAALLGEDNPEPLLDVGPLVETEKPGKILDDESRLEDSENEGSPKQSRDAPPPRVEKRVEINTTAGRQLKSFIERIERLADEKKIIADDTKEIYAEAKSMGFETKAIREIVKLRAKDAAMREELESMVDLYLQSIGMKLRGD